jgi:flagellar motor protein MotB
MRANAVKKLLIEKYAIPDSIIEAVGKGISKRYNEIERNRRVEIFVFTKVE